MSDDVKLVWLAQTLPQETVADAAERFVAETFGVERTIRWGDEPGMFRFHDGFWCYRISFGAIRN